METIEAIHTRQSAKKVKPDPVARELIEKLLSAAVQAPNHYKVRPWRFVVLTGTAREKLGEVMAQVFLDKFPDLTPEAQEKALEKERSKPLRSPVLIAVGVDKPAESKVIEIENVCATSAACENLLLAAHDLGLAAKWRTGDPARDPKVKEFLGFEPDQHLIAFLYIGHPEFELDPVDRPSFEDRTTWMD
ncbi:MAG: nitroreductase [Anaerolineales bacterium]|jgi:nitroreductase